MAGLVADINETLAGRAQLARGVEICRVRFSCSSIEFPIGRLPSSLCTILNPPNLENGIELDNAG